MQHKAAMAEGGNTKEFVEEEDDTAFNMSSLGERDEDGSMEAEPKTCGKHCHRRDTKREGADKTACRKLIVACTLCLCFVIGEVIGGVLANSLTIMADAARMLTYFASLMINFFSLYIGSRPPTKKMSFGWHRAEVMGTLVSMLIIWILTAVLLHMATHRLVSDDYEINAKIMLFTAAAGVTVNITLAVILHQQHCHSPDNGGRGYTHGSTGKKYNQKNGEHYQIKESNATKREYMRLGESKEALMSKDDKPGKGEPKKEVNINVRAAFIYTLADLLQSGGVVIAACCIYFRPDWKLADPICTFIFSLLALGSTITILRDTILVLMEGVPRGIKYSEVKICFCEIEGVKEVHDLRLWSLTTNKTAVSVHLAVDETVSSDVLEEARTLMHDRFGIQECTVQLEKYTSCMKDCTQCRDPRD